ncbi:molybdenum cofactor biosynthesis protein MoaE [soil metagenome]
MALVTMGRVSETQPATQPRERVVTRVQDAPISLDETAAAVADDSAGAVCIFTGSVRDHSGAGEVTGLTYEAWRDLAEHRLRSLGEEILERWPARRVAIVHRVGELTVGETSVIVAVSAPHRAEAFEACRHGIERLKDDVPIWKKEGLVSGEAHWVMGS